MKLTINDIPQSMFKTGSIIRRIADGAVFLVCQHICGEEYYFVALKHDYVSQVNIGELKETNFQVVKSITLESDS